MAHDMWFSSFKSMFDEALDSYDISGWKIKRMPNNVGTDRRALEAGRRKGWPFRLHNGRAKFECPWCRKKWTSAYTTIVWRANWNAGVIQINIEEQGCQRCNRMGKVSVIDEEHIEFALDWMCQWLLEVFYGIRNEENSSSDDEPDEEKKITDPHDCGRCNAGKKGTCKKCNAISRQQTVLVNNQRRR
ncbi:unnamed protein product [Rotaria socialis]